VAPFTHGQLGYLQIPALDLEASARFYERVFGWRVAPPQTEFEAPGLIGQWVTDRPPAPEAGPVVWIEVDDIGRALEQADRSGGAVLEEPFGNGPRMLASVSDPSGNHVGIYQLHGDRHGPLSNRTMPPCTIIPQLVYDDVPAAIEWLCDKFGFTERWRVGDHRAQLSIGDGTVAITEPRTSHVLSGRQSVMVRVEDAATHHERARHRGAQILKEPRDFAYGERQYTAADLGGHHWTFSESIADVRPEDWGGTSGPALSPRAGGPRPAGG
jgi:predicted enzyme related to lactoylglutathione lyase